MYSYLNLLLSQIETISEQIGTDGKRLADKVLKDLDQKERRLVTDLQNSVSQLSTTLSESGELVASQAKDVVDSTAIAMSVLPGSKDHPRVKSISPFYVSRNLLEANEDDRIQFDVKGLFLKGDNEPLLNIGDHKCATQVETDQKLTFACSEEAILTQNSITKIDRLTGKLTIYRKRKFWQDLFRGQPKEINYDIGLAILPKYIGKVTITSKNEQIIDIPEETEEIVTSKTANFYKRNSFCTSNTQQGQWNIYPSKNTFIDTKFQPKIIETNGNQERSYSIQTFRSDIIVINYRLQNGGRCYTSKWSPVKDKRASLGIRVHYQEKTEKVVRPARKKSQLSSSNIVEDEPIEWGRDLKFDNFPNNSINFIIEFKLFDGREIIRNISNFGDNDKYFSVSYDRPSKVLIIKPIYPDQID